MRKIYLSILFPIFTLIFSTAFSQEEKISFDVTMTSQDEATPPFNMTFYIDGKKMAAVTEMQGNKMRIILDPSTKEAITLMDLQGQKMGMKVEIPDMPKIEDASDKELKEKYKLTGNTKKINGYNTKEVLITHEEGGKSSLWLTEEIDFDYFAAMKAFNSGNTKGNDPFAKLTELGVTGFPMVIKNYGPDGELIMTMEMKNIKRTFDNSIFSTEGYTIREMPAGN